MNPWIRTSF